jgi:hypothetical protein
LREKCVEQLMEIHKWATLTSTQILYVYQNGIFEPQPVAAKIIMEHVRAIMGEYCSSFDQKEVLNTIKTLTFVPDDYFDSVDKRFIAVNDGVLDFEA